MVSQRNGKILELGKLGEKTVIRVIKWSSLGSPDWKSLHGLF